MYVKAVFEGETRHFSIPNGLMRSDSQDIRNRAGKAGARCARESCEEGVLAVRVLGDEE